ncbi:unnamed protein product [Musa hybrid cultivar]
MDTGRSFKGYEKVSEIAGRQFRRTTQRRLVLIASAAVVLLVTIIAVGVATSSGRPPSPTSVSDSIKAVCRVTPYPNSCFSSISSARDSSVTAEIFKLSLSLSLCRHRRRRECLNLGGIVRVPRQRQAARGGAP